ncbi:MAG: 30S ribosomal protein S16 [bacterium]
MLKIRLQRVGRKHEPSFRLVLTDSKNSTKSGKFNEILGSYDPRKSIDSFNTDRIKHWLSKGAQATGTVHNLLITHKIIEGKKRNVLPKKSPPIKEETPIEAPADENVEKDVTIESAQTTEDVQSGGESAS